MQVIIMTSDNYYHCLPPFLRQWHKYFDYWNNNTTDIKMVICGFSPLPDIYHKYGHFNFYSIGKYGDYPAQKWSDAFIKVLDNVADDTFILMLEDYWLFRPVDVQGVKMLYDYAKQFNTLKIDLATDRLTDKLLAPPEKQYPARVYEHCGYLDLIKSPKGSNYQLSLWGGIWRRDLLRSFIIPGEKAQEIEMRGTERVNNWGDDLLVLGTWQAPMPHANIYWSAFGKTPQYADPYRLREEDRKSGTWWIRQEDLDYMKQYGIWDG